MIFQISAREATQLDARGTAAYFAVLDEAAHIARGGSTSSAEDLYEAVTPALDQCGYWAMIPLPSTPWQQTGQLWRSYQLGLEQTVDGQPVDPGTCVVELTSWDPYVDWERSHEIPRRTSYVNSKTYPRRINVVPES